MMLRLWFTQKVKGVEMKNKNATILPQVRYTIAQHQFTCHMDSHKADVELTDSLCSRKSVEKLCSGGIPSKYKYLQQDIRLKNVNSAYSVVQHLKGFMYASLIKQFHDYVMEYFRTVLALIAKNPNKGTVLLQLRSACNRKGYQSLDFSFSEEEILNALNVSQLKELFAKRILRGLEQKRDSLDLIRALYKTLGKSITKTVNEAMPYLEMRHLLVHNGERYDQKFIDNYGKCFTDVKAGGRINLNFEKMKCAAKCLRALVREFDKFVVKEKFVRDEDIWNPVACEEGTNRTALDYQTSETE